MRQRLVWIVLGIAAVLAAAIAPSQAGAVAAPQTYTLTAKQFCKAFGHHVSCRSGYHDFHGTITHYQIKYYSDTAHSTPFKAAGTSCTHLSLQYWDPSVGGYSDDYTRIDIETTKGTAKGTRGTQKRMGKVSGLLNRKPFEVHFRLSGNYSTTYINGSATGCTTKDGTK